jgi:hypothetical protein
MPVSIILKDTIAFPFCNDSNLVLVVTLPSLVKFSALLTRFMKICDNFVGSPVRLSGMFGSISNIKLLLFSYSFKEF